MKKLNNEFYCFFTIYDHNIIIMFFQNVL